MASWIVTGGAGFIGSNFVRAALGASDARIVVVDKLTYAGNLQSLRDVADDPRFAFVQADIADRDAMDAVYRRHAPEVVVNFAAESHVDRSIDGPLDFVHTNVLGTLQLLEATRAFLADAPPSARERFRFLQISTDEVYGSLGPEGHFTEETAFAPNSPYSASKAGADHLVRAYHRTYGMPTLLTHCSNNYGPYQFPEKLVPLMILNALEGKPLPIYGDGGNVRDWLYVMDHCEAVRRALEEGRPGETYNIGGEAEMRNIDLVERLCALLDEERPLPGSSYKRLISFVTDRPGHDRRYAIDCARIKRELGWRPAESFDTGLRKTVRWYLDNPGHWS